MFDIFMQILSEFEAFEITENIAWACEMMSSENLLFVISRASL